jgi:lysophospholipase L1-like esterase
VNGERVDEIAERYQQCTDGADVVIVQGGINDIAQGGEADTIAAGIRELVQRAQEEDKQVLMVEILPWNNGGESAAKIIQETNGLLKTVAAEQSVPLLAWYELLRTPGGARRMRADLTIEGDHPSVAGYQKLGEYTASVLE